MSDDFSRIQFELFTSDWCSSVCDSCSFPCLFSDSGGIRTSILLVAVFCVLRVRPVAFGIEQL